MTVHTCPVAEEALHAIPRASARSPLMAGGTRHVRNEIEKLSTPSRAARVDSQRVGGLRRLEADVATKTTSRPGLYALLRTASSGA